MRGQHTVNGATVYVQSTIRPIVLQDLGKVVVDKLQPGMLLWPTVYHVFEEGVHYWCRVVLTVVKDERVRVVNG